MLRDLPKSVPSAILSAAEGALEDTEDLIERAGRAKQAYLAMKPTLDQHAHLTFTAMAQALVDWGAMLQDNLPSRGLASRFWTSGAAHGPCIVVVSTELTLPYRPGFQGGTLKTELSLALDAGEGLYRHDDWFDGYRMTGGGLLNTAIGLRNALHPDMLERIHGIVAENANGPLIVASLDRLAASHKDR